MIPCVVFHGQCLVLDRRKGVRSVRSPGVSPARVERGLFLWRRGPARIKRRRLVLLELPLRPLKMLHHMLCEPIFPSLRLVPMAPWRRGVFEALNRELDIKQQGLFWYIEGHAEMLEQKVNAIHR